MYSAVTTYVDNEGDTVHLGLGDENCLLIRLRIRLSVPKNIHQDKLKGVDIRLRSSQ